MEIRKIMLPLDDEKVKSLAAGDLISLNGYLYTGRDAAHKRMTTAIQKGGELPFNLNNETIYYVGPAPAKPGYVIGPAGPTTSYRMDDYTVLLLEKGLKGMIGKGIRSPEVIDAIKKYNAVYFTAVGGTAALISKSIKTREIIAYEDLGTEAVHRLYVEDFQVIVTIDSEGNNLYSK